MSHTAARKTMRKVGADSMRNASAGDTAVALAPPDYGIDFVDSGLRKNDTGLSDALKAGIETLSGFAMDDVKVHYNSGKPAQLHAVAYAQGTDIHVARGQERHVPHEAWHVVQQKQGRVKQTMQLKNGVPVNDDRCLEREADVMGARAAALPRSDLVARGTADSGSSKPALQRQAVVQRVEKGELLATVAGWSDIEQRLMEGVLDEASADAAVQKVYDNMFELGKDGTWKYKAGAGNSNGAPMIAGTTSTGMCETYRNAFKVMLEKLAELTADYEPFSDGFDIVEGQALVGTKFVTNPDLALLGKAQGYNVSKKLDASTGTVTAEKRYLFSSHWQLIVNGKTYDPLFQGVDQDNMAWEIKAAFGSTYYTTTDGVSFSPNQDGPTAGGEFGGQYYMITNTGAFEGPIGDLDPVKVAHAKLTEVKVAVQKYYDEWNVQGPGNTKAVKDWWTGKTAWHTPIQEDVNKAPQWVTRLTEVNALVAPGVREDTVLNKVTDTVALNLITELRFQAREAKKEIENLIETDETTEVGRRLGVALVGLNKVLQAPIMKDV